MANWFSKIKEYTNKLVYITFTPYITPISSESHIPKVIHQIVLQFDILSKSINSDNVLKQTYFFINKASGLCKIVRLYLKRKCTMVFFLTRYNFRLFTLFKMKFLVILFLIKLVALIDIFKNLFCVFIGRNNFSSPNFYKFKGIS